jgi:hypothetical protein
VDRLELIKLAEEFGLPCVEREQEITIIGYEHLLIFSNDFFNNMEETQCQIY